MSATPPAGSSIGNQASATYTDGSGTQRTATSNTTTTYVQQVASLLLTQDNTKPVSPGGQVDFPHTLKNTGNGPDTYSLVIGGGTGFSTNNIYEDANGDGVPDDPSKPITSSGPLAAGAVFKFVIVSQVPASPSTATYTLTVTATSAFNGSLTAANTDTANVTPNAVINVTKSINIGTGPAGSGPYTYTLTYNNSGNTTATNLTLKDVIPAGMTYVAGTAKWSVSGSTFLNDNTGANDPVGINYDYNDTVVGRVTAIIATVVPGQSGTVTFQVNVNAGLAPQNIDNQAKYSYNDGQTVVGDFDSNVARFTIPQLAAVSITSQTITNPVPQGSVVSFTNVVSNLGNGDDTFNITVLTNNNTFPQGTTFLLYQSDGVTPLLDSNNDNLPDTGPRGPNGPTNTYSVVVKAILPGNATGANFTVQIQAKSTFNSAVTAVGTDIIGTVSASTVDLTNDSPGGPGSGPGPEVNAVTTLTVTPTNAVTVRFTNYVANSSAAADSYEFAASTDSSFSSLSLPSGWTVVFRNASNGTITGSGVVNAGANMLFYADVTVPAQFAPGTNAIYFRVRSPNTGATDSKHDAVAVNTFRSISITPNNSAQIFPGGSVVYSHTIQNNGNVTEGGTGSSVNVGVTNSLGGWTAVVYYDANGSSSLDTNEVIITSIPGSIAPGATVKVLVKVFAPPGAPIGAINASVINASVANLSYSTTAPTAVNATDATTVISADLTLLKKQALDTNCDGTVDMAFTTSDINTALPGNCLRYEITVKNNGSTSATNIVLSDATPSFTTFSTNGAISVIAPVGVTVTTNSVPANGTAGTISVSLDTLAPGASAILNFGVKINP